MSSDTLHRLGDLQLAILQALWKRGASGVAEIQQVLGQPLAYTTVATMLKKMEHRGLVRHRHAGRRFIYEAAVSADDVSRGMANRLVERLFEGSLARTVRHLLATREVDSRELAELERLIRRRRKENP
jgi:predicted transcriptional regulator